jgi:hypothetical protein
VCVCVCVCVCVSEWSQGDVGGGDAELRRERGPASDVQDQDQVERLQHSTRCRRLHLALRAQVCPYLYSCTSKASQRST